MTVRTLALIILCAGSAVATAQPVAPANGPIACFTYADGQVRLARPLALDLCLGAASDAPARCAAAVIDVVRLPAVQAVQLCRGATSTQPAQCAGKLDDLDYTDQQIGQLCRASPYPLVPAPGGGGQACAALAGSRTRLSTTDIVQLCTGSSSTMPVHCYEAGDAATTLSDRELVTLCATMIPWPYPQRGY